MASTMDLILASPRLSASATHSSEYPFPLKTILWCPAAYCLIKSCTATLKSSAFSSTSQASEKASATIVFNTTFDCATESWEPTIRNSNLLPVNANGDVRLRSVASLRKSGSVFTPVSSICRLMECVAMPVLINCENTSSSCSPKNTDRMAGGASFAPSLWSFPTSAAEARSNSACSSTALIIQVSTSRN